MAQIKKLQNGGVSSSEPKKRIYNGVELTDEDINKVISHVGEWGTQNANYSEDIRKWSELAAKAKENLLQGNIPTFDPTGTSMGDITPGKTNQNIFGNWAGENLNRQFSTILKSSLDQITNKSNNTTITTSNSIPDKKYHQFVSGLISNKYFAGNWENAQKGISEWDENTRKNRVREALIESINNYKNEYNEDSPYSNTLSELNDPNISIEKLKEIGYKMGTDVSDILTGSKIENTDPYASLKQYGEIIEDPYLSSKGYIGLKDKQGKVRLIDKNDITKEIQGQPGTYEIETNWGENYGKGLFYDQNTGWHWGTKEELSKIPSLYNFVQQIYSELYNKNKINPQKINFNTHYHTALFPLRDQNNQLEYFDISNQFNNLGENRIFIPKNKMEYDVLGNIDLKKSTAYYFDKLRNKIIRIGIELNPTGPSTARGLTQGFENETFDLGAFGKNIGTQIPLNIQTTFLGNYSPLDDISLKRGISYVNGFTNITKDNTIDFLNKAIKRDFFNDLKPDEAGILYNVILKVYNDYKDSGGRVTPQSIDSLNRLLTDLKSGQVVKTNKDLYRVPNKNKVTNNYGSTSYSPYSKGGSIKRYQAGGGLTANIQQPLNTDRFKSQKLGYGSSRIRDIGNKTMSGADIGDTISIGADALSLIGGPVGVGAGLVGMISQGIADSSRNGFFSKETLTNLGINLGFTLLAAIPGGGLIKGTKLASKVNKIKNAKELLKVVETTSKIGKSGKELKKLDSVIKTANEVVNASKNETKLTKFADKINATLNNKGVRTASNVVRTGMIGLGAGMGISSAGNIINDVNTGGLGAIKTSDIRGLVAGAGAVKGIKENLNRARVRKVTESNSPITTVNKKVKVENAPEGFKELEEIEISRYKNADEATAAIRSKITEKIKQIEPTHSELKNKLDLPENKDNKLLKEQFNKLDKQLESLKKSEKYAKINTNIFKNIANKLGNTKENISSRTSKYWKEKIVGDFDNRSIKSEYKDYKFDEKGKIINGENLKRGERKGLQLANKAGYFDDKDMFLKEIDLLKNLKNNRKVKKFKYSQIEHPDLITKLNKNLLMLPEVKPRLALPPMSARPMPEYSYSNPKNARPMQQFTESNSKYKKPIIKSTKKSSTKYKKSDKRNINKMKKEGRVEENNQTKLFKQGGLLIPKFQNPNKPIDYISGQNLEGNTQIIEIPYEIEQPEVFETPIIYPIKNNTNTNTNKSNTSNLYNPNLQKRSFSFDSSLFRELPKLTNSLWTNRRNAQLLSGIKPVLLQNPTEIYKPVVTNLINENAVNNQATSFLRRNAIPITSDATLQKAGILEAMSKVNPLLIQARGENTNMYNQSLANSMEAKEKYASHRNEIANENRQRIGANEARLANIEAGKNIANNASWGNFFDKSNQVLERNLLYKRNLENQQKLQELQREFEDKLKPFEESYTKLSDKVNSNAYKLFLKRNAVNWDSDILDNGKTGAQLLKEEQEQKYKLWQDERNKLKPFYQNQMLALNNSNPYLTTIKYNKSGGELTAKSRVEIQHLKNKLKEKELNAEYADKSLDRKQKEVKSILNGLSKETFFLLKTILGK